MTNGIECGREPRRRDGMAKTVRVTTAQVNAAKLKIQRSAVTGRSVSRGVQAIANAKPSSSNGTASRNGRAAPTTR